MAEEGDKARPVGTVLSGRGSAPGCGRASGPLPCLPRDAPLAAARGPGGTERGWLSPDAGVTPQQSILPAGAGAYNLQAPVLGLMWELGVPSGAGVMTPGPTKPVSSRSGAGGKCRGNDPKLGVTALPFSPGSFSLSVMPEGVRGEGARAEICKAILDLSKCDDFEGRCFHWPVATALGCCRTGPAKRAKSSKATGGERKFRYSYEMRFSSTGAGGGRIILGKH